MSKNKEWERFKKIEPSVKEEEFPKISIIIPTLNAAPLIGATIESLISQDYPDFEIIVIDAGSHDRTHEILKSLRDERIKIYSVTGYKRYEMVNKGITHSSGRYVNVMFPGDFYIHRSVLRNIMHLAFENEMPALLYCGTLLRDGRSDVKILYRPLTKELLKNGKQPTSIQSCWFRSDVFRRIGKFKTDLELRGGYDLLCRFLINGTLSFTSTSRVLTDYDLRSITRSMVVRHFLETYAIILEYFGLKAAIKWIFLQKDTSRYMKSWLRSLRVAFLGKT